MGGVSDAYATGYRSVDGFHQTMALYDSILERWGVAYESHTVATRHGKTHVITCGAPSAPPLVLLHGAAVNALMWQPNAAELSQRLRLILPDIPGHLGRSEPVHFSLGGEAPLEWLVDVFDAFQLTRPNLGGASLGGWFALQAAARIPERVNDLILVASYGNTPFTIGFVARSMLTFAVPTRGNVERFMRYISAPGYAIDPETTDFMLHAVKDLRPPTSPPARLDKAKLSKFAGRTLHIVGENETVCDPQRGVREIKNLLPDVQSVIVPRAGHAVNGEQAVIVNKAIIDFLM